MKLDKNWPVLKSYDSDHLRRVALPLGGIGTGTVSLGGRGDLRQFEIMNRPAKRFTPEDCFFALYAKPAGGEAVTRLLEGPIPPEDYEGQQGCPLPNNGAPRFRKASFHAAYPLAQVLLSDADVPLDVRLEAFNPFVPPDADKSGIPVAVLRYVLRNKTSRPVAAAVCGSFLNFIGHDGAAGEAKGNVNTFRTSGGLRGLFMRATDVPKTAPQWGTMALTTTAATNVSHRTAMDLGWGGAALDFWDDFSSDGKLTQPRTLGDKTPVGALAVGVKVPPRGTKAVTFLLTWHFPNRRTWTPKETGGKRCAADRVGNYYTTQYRDAWDAAVRTARRLPALEAETVAFVRAFCESDLPEVVKEAALFNLSTLRTQTCFRTEDGRFFGWEGCSDTGGCCHGSCTHVWNYEQGTAFLFGPLARSMRDTEFAKATLPNGLMNFRVSLPLSRAKAHKAAAADGQMGCLMKLYRDWQLSGDDAMLRRLWPHARRALAFCWVPGGWDADQDGVMEGCQHNTMDVEYYGPNGQMGIWYLGALRAAEEMARHVGDEAFADRCRSLFERGRAWIDANLFNGEYYEHHVRPMKADEIAEGCRLSMGALNTREPDYQLGKACLVDQLVGQYMAHVCGLGYLVDPKHVRQTLRSILKYNFKDLHAHFNNMRTFVLNDERAVLMATYPRGERPRRPFPYFNEVMTGFEYAAAVGMLYEGRTADGLRLIAAIRDRYDGRRRSPFDEAECGHHYARAMAAWAAVLALTGFHYSAVDRTMTFAAKDGRFFWSTGDAWGTCRIRTARRGARAELAVGAGRLRLKRFRLAGVGEAALGTAGTLGPGKTVRFKITGAPSTAQGKW